MPSRRYRKNAEECLDRAAQARKSEDLDAWLLIAEDWLRLAVEFDAAKQQSRTPPATLTMGVVDVSRSRDHARRVIDASGASAR